MAGRISVTLFQSIFIQHFSPNRMAWLHLQEAVIAELREEMQKLSKYEEAVRRVAEMEALDDSGKEAQAGTGRQYSIVVSYLQVSVVQCRGRQVHRPRCSYIGLDFFKTQI